MIPLQRIIAGIASLLMILLIIDLLRRKKLREEYSLLWLAAGLVMFVIAIRADVIDLTAKLLKINHPAYGVIVIALFIGLILSIHFTIVLSKLTGQVWRLVQEVGLLRAQVDELEQRYSKEESVLR